MAIIEKVKRINKNAYVIARGTLIQNVEMLYKTGADQVLPEKLELAIDLLNRILVKKLLPQKEINRVLTHLRNTSLGAFSEKDKVNQPSLLDEFPNINISAVTVEAGSPAEGSSIIESDLRRRTGVTLLAIRRGTEIIEHPIPETIFRSNDIAYLLGDPEQINYASELLLRKSQ